MLYFAIRHKQSGEYMPLANNNKGYSYWLKKDDKFEQAIPGIIRLFATKQKAEKSIVEWAKGYYIWVDKPDANWWHDQVRKMVNPDGRTKDDLEVVTVNLLEQL